MEWVPLTNYETGINHDDRPRKLTSEELKYITSHLPLAPSADSFAAEVSRQGIIEWMIETLKEVDICPSAIPSLIQNIIEQHNKSLITPGTPVGINAAEALGATTTQMTLNSVSPHELIIIQESYGTPHIYKIGKWIDNLLLLNSSKIQYFPENRTQYFELPQPVNIATPHSDGSVTWEKITAVTKHLPVGDMVKIKTKTGREVTATQSKSLLVWNGKELVQTPGKDIKIDDLVPVLSKIPDPPVLFSNKDGIELDHKVGSYLGVYWCGNPIKPEKEEWKKLEEWVKIGKSLPTELLFTSKDFLTGFLKQINIKEINSAGGSKLLDQIRFAQARAGLCCYDVINNISLDPIVSVDYIPASEYVYDLTVPVTTNFSLLNGLGISDTFHSSGSSKSASFGIEAMRDLIFARKNPKNESCTIYYTNKTASYEEILETRKYIVGSVVSDFIKDYDIDDPNVLEKYWWHNTAGLLLNKEPPPCTQVLRLFLNTIEMFKHKVTIADLASVLERDIPPSVTTIYGPIGDGIIDVYPHPAHIIETLKKDKDKENITPDLAELTFLETIVVPGLGNIRVKGISGIRKLYPVVSPVWRMVLLERKVMDSDLVNQELVKLLTPYLGNAWILFYNPGIMRKTGLIPENLSALCSLAGLKIIGGIHDRLIISMPNDRFRNEHGDTISIIDGKIYREIPNKDILVSENTIYREVNSSLIKEFDGFWREQTDTNRFRDFPTDDVRLIDDKIYVKLERDKLRQLDEKYFEQLDPELVNIKELKPSEYVDNKVTSAKKEHKSEIKRLTDLNILAAQKLPPVQKRALIQKNVIVPRSPLMKAAEFIIAETDGANLKQLLALPTIDKTRTTCNNMYTIAETFGIEAARSFLIDALTNTIANNNSYVHPANILLIAEFITSRGEPYGATYVGISRQPGGHLSLATLERAGQVFTNNALYGRKEDIRNVSASVAVGARMAIGSGSFDIAQDITEGGVSKTVINDDLFDALKRDDNTNLIVENRKNQLPYDIKDDIDDLKDLHIGARFDNVGEENATNLLNLFNETEVIPDVGLTHPVLQPSGKLEKNIRRVGGNQEPIVPTDLIEAISQINIGIPLQEQIVIKPLEGGITKPTVQPVVSTGFVSITPEELIPQNIDTGIPDELRELFTEFGLATEDQPEELPQVEIPTLPDISGINFQQTAIELRREQVRNLEPIDVSKLQTALGGK